MKCSKQNGCFLRCWIPCWTLRSERQLAQHMNDCGSCTAQFAELRRTSGMMAGMAQHAAPPELALRLKVAVSQQLAARRHSRWESLFGALGKCLNAFMFPATAGLLSAVLIFGVLIGVIGACASFQRQ